MSWEQKLVCLGYWSKTLKFFRNDREVQIEPRELDPSVYWLRKCMSPIYQPVPGCVFAFYSCEWEDHYGPVKHNPDFVHYKRIKKGTSVNCREMPIEYCQNLINGDEMVCPQCNQRIE